MKRTQTVKKQILFNNLINPYIFRIKLEHANKSIAHGKALITDLGHVWQAV